MTNHQQPRDEALERRLDELGRATRSQPDARFESRLADATIDHLRPPRSFPLIGLGAALAAAAALAITATLWMSAQEPATPLEPDITTVAGYNAIEAELATLEAELATLEHTELDDWSVPDWGV